jgi:hypothetical protein
MKFTPAELREFKPLRKLPAEALDLLAVRLDKLDVGYRGIEKEPIPLDAYFLFGRVVEHPPAVIDKHHRWHDLAWRADGALREAVPKLGHGLTGPAARFVAWVIERITGEKVEVGTVGQKLYRRSRKRRSRKSMTTPAKFVTGQN